MTDDVIYRCSYCRKINLGPLGMHGDLCPQCETGHLTTIVRVTARMLAEAETALNGAEVGT